LSEDGSSVALAPGRQFKELGRGRLEGRFMASPAAVGKALILRTEKALYRVEQGKER
jgi:hypothetical protein